MAGIRFTVDGQEVALTVYRNGHGFFLPFADALAGTETYGAGRYLEPAELPGGQLLIDFNLAYNPYCAYNDAWSCPITPAENRLRVPISGGRKTLPARAVALRTRERIPSAWPPVTRCRPPVAVVGSLSLAAGRLSAGAERIKQRS